MSVNSYVAFNGYRGKTVKPKEITALLLYSRDATIYYIAKRIGVKPKTVYKILERLRNKLGAYSNTNAYVKAKRLRLL